MKIGTNIPLTGSVFLLFSLFLLASCGGGGSGYTPPPPPPSSTVQIVTCPMTADATVNAVGTASFSPDPVPITVNQVVRWNNAAGTTHSVTSTTVPANGTFSADFNSGTSVCLQFTAAGAFNYHCRFHTNMAGVVNVN